MNYQNEVTLHNFGETGNLDIGDIADFVHSRRNMVHIGNSSNPVATLGSQGIQIGGMRELFQLPSTRRDKEKKEHTLPEVLKVLSANDTDVSLNHVGFGYQVEDTDAEVQRIIEVMKDSTHKLYEDPIGVEENMRRLFVGNAESNAPMCEIVLPEKHLQMRPHVQFDVDTPLSHEKIEQRMEAYFDDNFFDWTLDIENVGKVVSMGTFENRWIDLKVGVGTNLRSREDHRKSMIELS